MPQFFGFWRTTRSDTLQLSRRICGYDAFHKELAAGYFLGCNFPNVFSISSIMLSTFNALLRAIR